MTPDDPRHGTLAGEQAHRYEGTTPCDPCRHANAEYQRYTRALHGARSMNLSDGLGTRRRVEALMALGWSGQQIADDAGMAQCGVWAIFRRTRCTATVSARIAATYDRLSMRLPTTDTKGQRISVSRTRAHAARRGFAPPLAWNNIDDPTETPATGTNAYGRNRYDVDPVVVDRLLGGERVASTWAERDEAMRRWKRAGKSERSLCELHGWRDGRYGRDDVAA